MKVSNWSIAIGGIGLLIIIGSCIRYFLIWNDPSQGFLFMGLGIGALTAAWIYNRMLEIQNTLKAVEDYLADESG